MCSLPTLNLGVDRGKLSSCVSMIDSRQLRGVAGGVQNYVHQPLDSFVNMCPSSSWIGSTLAPTSGLVVHPRSRCRQCPLTMKWCKLSETEITLAKRWYVEENLSAKKIAQRLKRSPSTVSRLVVKKVKRNARGRKPLLTKNMVDKLVAKLESLIREADSQYEVTVTMLKRSSRCKASPRTILRRLHERNIYFRPLREKPVLTEKDIADRLAFAKSFAPKTKVWWNSSLHMIIDVKHFRVLPHGDTRKYAAQETTRGTYRKKGQGLNKGHTKPVTKTKFNPGATGIKVLAGVGKGKVILWEYLEGSWGREAAAEAYKGPIKKALQTNFPGRKTFTVLEDNDPAGFKSGLGVAAKRDVGIKAFEIPKRSPCLNVLDYHVWAEVNKRMREQEKKFPSSKRESRKAFLNRLRRTTQSLPSAQIASSVGDMERRCARLLAAKGGNIEEGGKGSK